MLTNREAAVGAAQVDVALGDGGHAELIVGTREEGGQRARKHDVPLTRCTAHGNAHLGDRQRDERNTVQLQLMATITWETKKKKKSIVHSSHKKNIVHSS